jgi:glycosyltransferase involved in cell wall biosynthesis
LKTSNQTPLVSIILLAYNQGKFIREAVEGVLEQSYSPLEILISDDASPDNTFEIILEAVAEYNGPHRLIVNRNETNMGLCAHVAKAVTMTKGEWLVATAGDDISSPNRCEKLVEAACARERVSLVTSGWTEMMENGVSIETPLPRRFADGRIDLWGDHKWCARFMRGSSVGVHGATSMWSRRLIEAFDQIASDVAAEDAVMSFRAYLTGDVAYLPDRLVRYRRHSSNLCGSVHDDQEVAEHKAIAFEKRNSATLRQMREDFEKYRVHLDNPMVVLKISSCLEWLSYRHETHVKWENHGTLWRLGRMIRCLRQRNKTEFMWCLRRLSAAYQREML